MFLGGREFYPRSAGRSGPATGAVQNNVPLKMARSGARTGKKIPWLHEAAVGYVTRVAIQD
jgi:hypothetical protein